MSIETKATNQGDRMLWVLGAGVCILAVAFFAFLNLDGFGSADEVPAARQNTAIANQSDVSDASADVDVPDYGVQLNRALLALDAGMLIEPEGFSAWSIYADILAADAQNEAAQTGLAQVADSLADEAHEKFNAGRRDEAQALAQRVLDRFPNHADALDVIDRIDEALDTALAAAEPVPAPPQRVAAEETDRDTPEPAPPPAPPAPSNPIAEIYTDFTRALADDRLRAPAQENALSHYVAMRDIDSAHAMTTDAGQQLLDALFVRHNEAFNRLDTETSTEWLDLAESLDVDAVRVSAAREQMMDLLAEEASREPVSASEFTLRNYSAPVYPNSALRRDLEGWVDIAFVLSRDGRPTQIEVVEASNSVFREPATRAVEAWEFEPYSAYDRVVEQHAQTRIRFVLED